MMYKFVRSALGVAIAVACVQGNAQEFETNSEQQTDIEELGVIGKRSTFGAFKLEIPAEETSRSITVNSAQAFLNRGALSLIKPLNYKNTLNYKAGVTGNAFGFAPPPLQVVTDANTLFDVLVDFHYEHFGFTLGIRNLCDELFDATCLSRGDCFAGEQRTIAGNLRTHF